MTAMSYRRLVGKARRRSAPTTWPRPRERSATRCSAPSRLGCHAGTYNLCSPSGAECAEKSVRRLTLEPDQVDTCGGNGLLSIPQQPGHCYETGRRTTREVVAHAPLRDHR